MKTSKDLETELIEEIATFYADPLGHVRFSYPWGKGSLDGFEGPDDWAVGYLTELAEEIRARGFDGIHAVEPIMFSTSSGHGIGKSAMVSWLVRFYMDTRPHCKGVVTANTAQQLRTKTWSELAKWHNVGITKHWYQLNAGSQGSLNIYHKHSPETWRFDAQTCEERNSESFAGLHAANSSPVYIFDEASAVPEKIFEVREGGLTDGEPHVHDFGNPTRNSGRFFENTFGRYRSRYHTRSIDSRTVRITNKQLIDQWAETYGEESDFFKVRVLGRPPDTGSLQFIPTSLVNQCTMLDVPQTSADPVVIGVDVARFGDDESVIWTRRGRDCESLGYFRYSGMDTMTLASRVAEIASKHMPDAVFVDGGGVGGGVVDRLRQLNVPVTEINFGAKATQSGYGNMAAQMWGNLREVMKDGIRIPDDDDLRMDLTGREYGFTPTNLLQLERKDDMKKRGLKSPDLADALALTWAYPVFPSRLGFSAHQDQMAQTDYDPFKF
jgi:hypothetical protein